MNLVGSGKKNPKIMFLIDSIETDKAGTEGQLLEIIYCLKKKKIECHLGCFTKTQWIKSNDIGVKVFNVGSQSLYNPKLFLGLISLITYLRSNKIDIVHTFFPTSITIGVLFSKLAGVKHIISSRRDMGFWYTPVSMFFVRISNKFADRILVNSKEVMKNVVKKEKVKAEKIDVIYNGVKKPIYENNKDRRNLRSKLAIPFKFSVVGTVANLNRHVKRIDVFIDAAKIVLGKNKNVIFIIIGEGHLKRQYLERSKKIGISNKIIFLGSIHNVFEYLSIFDVAVNCSDSEGFSNAILEYLVMGIPVVATNVGGNVELINNFKNGLLVRPGNPKDIAESILQILQDKVLQKSVRLGALESSKLFSIELMVKKHLKYYENLV